jgi:hypothetical protein
MANGRIEGNAESNIQDPRDVIADMLSSGFTRLAAEVVSMNGLESEYPDLIALSDAEEAIIQGN